MNPLESFIFTLLLSLHKNNSYIALAAQILQNQLLNQFVHPKNIFLFTDSFSEIPQEFISRNAISIIPMTNHPKNDLNNFCSHRSQTSSRIFLLININIKFMENNFTEYYSKFTCLSGLSTKWKPIILVTISGAGNWSFSQQRHLVRQTFAKKNHSNSIPLSLDSVIYLIFMNTQTSNLWEVYIVKEILMVSQLHKRSYSLPLSVPTPLKQESVFYLQAFVERRSNFHNQKFTASVKTTAGDDWATVENSKSSDGENTLILTKGYVAYLYHDLQRLLNFSQNIIFGDSPKIVNGTLSGITVSQLNSDEADVTLTLMSASEERLRSLAFLIPTHTSLAYAFFKQPPPNSLRNIVVAPFNKSVWLALFSTCFIIVLSVKFHYLPICTIKSSKTPKNKVILDDDHQFVNESGLWAISTLCQKPWYSNPNSLSLRLKLVFVSLMTLTVYTAYCTFIISTMAVISIPIKSLEDLLNPKNQFILTAHEYSQPFQRLLEGYIKFYELPQKKVETVSTDIEVSHLFSRDEINMNSKRSRRTSLSISTFSENVVTSSRMALLSYADIFYEVAGSQNYSEVFTCNQISYFRIYVGYLTKSSLMVKKGSQFKETLNYMLIHLRSVGLVNRNDERYNNKHILKCNHEAEQLLNGADSTSFTDVFTIILVILVGMPTAVVILTIERRWHSYKPTTEQELEFIY